MTALSKRRCEVNWAMHAIALGSNLGDSRAILEAALATLAATSDNLQAESSWYQTTAVGPPQPDYINGCALLHVQTPPHVIRNLIENWSSMVCSPRRWGAIARPRFTAIWWLNFEYSNSATAIHEWKNAFVLVPLGEIAPDWVEPVSGCAIAELIKL